MKTGTRRFLIATAILPVALAGCTTASKLTAPAAQAAPVEAPAAPQVAAAPAPAPTLVIKDVNFDFDRSTLKPEATATLDEVAGALRRQPGVRYEVAGFTDSISSEAYNQALSERRAEAVGAYLVGQGVDSGQLIERGYGESSFVASNATSEGRAQNRRVEVRPVN